MSGFCGSDNDEDYDVLRAQRDAARAEVADLKSSIESLAMPGPWAPDAQDDDQDLPEEEQIHAAHPITSGRHDLFAEAMRLVRAKRSKYGLIGVITWLLLREDLLRARLAIYDAATSITFSRSDLADDGISAHQSIEKKLGVYVKTGSWHTFSWDRDPEHHEGLTKDQAIAEAFELSKKARA